MSILRGVRVIEISGDGTAAMAARHFADWGAEVVILEPASGTPLRDTPPYYDHDGERRSGNWAWLSRGKSVLRVGDGSSCSPARGRELCADADVVLVEATLCREVLGVDPGALLEDLNGRTTCVLIAPFALDGPYADYRATDLGLCGIGGWMWAMRDPRREPIRPGMDVLARSAGVAAFNAALLGLRIARAGGHPQVVELSQQAVVASMFTATWLAKTLLGIEMPPSPNSFPIGPVQAKDGWVGAPPLTAQHWDSLVRMMEAPHVLEMKELDDPMWRVLHGERLYRDHFQGWVERRARAEIVAEAQSWLIPSAGIETVADRLDCPQLTARGFYREAEIDDKTVRVPRVAYQIADADPVERESLREVEAVSWSERPAAAVAQPRLPLEGIRVLDLSTWWSGPSAMMAFGALGADVIKLESVQRPDGYRLAFAPPEDPLLYEKSYLWLDTNSNKRSLTLDLSSERGRELFDRMVEQSDIVISNYSNRVLPNLGITAERVHAKNPRAIFATMPGYAPGGPWGDYVGFGTAFEYTAVSASVTGYADGPPKQSVLCDPTVGFHAAAALLLALELREQTGRGTVVEIPQAETLDTLYAPEWIAVQQGAPVPTRVGNRHAWMAPHGAYATAGEENWITITVATDEQFRALAAALDLAELADDPRFVTVAARKEYEAELDALLAPAILKQDQLGLERELQSRGVMALRVSRTFDITQDEGLRHLGYFQWMERESVGEQPSRVPLYRFRELPTPNVLPPPLLGQHNHEVLSDVLGLSEDEVASLEADGVIGRAPVGLGV